MYSLPKSVSERVRVGLLGGHAGDEHDRPDDSDHSRR
jgi:hypothetical protein